MGIQKDPALEEMLASIRRAMESSAYPVKENHPAKEKNSSESSPSLSESPQLKNKDIDSNFQSKEKVVSLSSLSSSNVTNSSSGINTAQLNPSISSLRAFAVDSTPLSNKAQNPSEELSDSFQHSMNNLVLELEKNLRQSSERELNVVPESSRANSCSPSEAPMNLPSNILKSSQSDSGNPFIKNKITQAEKKIHPISRESNVSDSPFDAVSAEIASALSGSIEALAVKILQPMLQDWMDNNLPVLVEKLIREEIDRVVRGEV